MWVAAIQLTSTENMEKNLAKARELIKEAALHGATFITLPEHFAYLGPVDRSPHSGQPLEGRWSGSRREKIVSGLVVRSFFHANL